MMAHEAQTVFGLVGAGRFGREVMPLVRQAHPGLAEMGRCLFLEDEPISCHINGHEVLSVAEFGARTESLRRFAVAIADSRVRQRITDELVAAGAVPTKIQAATARIYDNCEIGKGSILCDYTMITSDVSVGIQFHLNIYSYVGHDCVIGDYVTFAPGVRCNGNVHVGDFAYIGSGAIIREGSPTKPMTIGAGAVVGMGAVVTKPVPPGLVVVGNPARPLDKRQT